MVNSTSSVPTAPSSPKSIEPDYSAIATHAAIKEIDANVLWDRITLGVMFSTFIVFVCPPLSGALQALYKLPETVANVATEIDEAVTPVAPKLDDVPRKGETVAGYVVTSPYLPCTKSDKSDCRRHPVSGEIKAHYGVDLDTRTGVPLYVIGNPGQEVTLTCRANTQQETKGGGLVAEIDNPNYPYIFQYLHLSICGVRIPSGQSRASAQIQAGRVLGKTGATGTGTGPHLDFRMKTRDQNYVPPQRQFLWWSLKGSAPRPTVSRGEEAK